MLVIWVFFWGVGATVVVVFVLMVVVLMVVVLMVVVLMVYE
jgi:hypothetical protein